MNNLKRIAAWPSTDQITLIEYVDGILARLQWETCADGHIVCRDCCTFHPDHAENCCIQAARKAAAEILKK